MIVAKKQKDLAHY